MKAFEEVYDSNWFIQGEKLKVFEERYASFSGAKYAAGISNGLDALFLSLKALGVSAGDEIIMPSNTFIATALAGSYLGAKPVFVEPNPDTFNIDPANIEQAITNKTKVIIPVHLYGQACEMDRVMEIAKANNLYVLEDNAQSQGSSFNGKITGGIGDIAGTSFYPGKNLGALGDAGAVTTNNEDLINAVKVLRNYGSKQKYQHDVVGHNMRMDEVQANLLNVKLARLKAWTKQRQQIASTYIEELKGVSWVQTPVTHEMADHVYHLFVIKTDFREKLQGHLLENGVHTLIHYPVPPHLQKSYQNLGLAKGDFPIAEKLANTVLSLPLWPGMSEDQQTHVIETIRQFKP